MNQLTCIVKYVCGVAFTAHPAALPLLRSCVFHMTGALLWSSLSQWMRPCLSSWRYASETSRPTGFCDRSLFFSFFSKLICMRWFIFFLNQCSVARLFLINRISDHSFYLSSYFCLCVFPWLNLYDQLILKLPLKSLVDVDPWHHLVETCFQRQSGGRSPHRVLLCSQTAGWEAFHSTLFCLVSLSSAPILFLLWVSSSNVICSSLSTL